MSSTIIGHWRTQGLKTEGARPKYKTNTMDNNNLFIRSFNGLDLSVLL